MKYALPIFALLLSGCASTVTPPQAAPKSAQEALRPYYAAMDVKLPKAPANPTLSADTVITRLWRYTANKWGGHPDAGREL